MALVAASESKQQLRQIASEIKSAHAECIAGVRTSLELAVKIGGLLIDAKRIVDHGDWEDWVERKCGFSRQTARRYMQVSKRSLVSDLDQDSTIRGLLSSSAKIQKVNEKVQSHEPFTVHSDGELRELNGEADVKFGCICADPPWQYGNQGTRASTDNHYETMNVDEICALPVSELAAEDAHLHLWTTNAFLFDAKRVMDAWGFEYKSVFVWVKPQMGIGNYWRVSHEFMLFGIRGKCPFLNRSEMSWRSFDRTTHSSKPNQIYDIIRKVSPGPYLEMFARGMRPGWTVWGNQVERTLLDAET